MFGLYNFRLQARTLMKECFFTCRAFYSIVKYSTLEEKV